MADDPFDPSDRCWLATVLLKHENPPAPDVDHFDWMLTNPDDPHGLLWTGRVMTPVEQWNRLDGFEFLEIHPHRRLYLSYEGAIAPSPDQPHLARGSVRRIACGSFSPLLWQQERRRLELRMAQAQGIMEMIRHHAGSWQCRLLAHG